MRYNNIHSSSILRGSWKNWIDTLKFSSESSPIMGTLNMIWSLGDKLKRITTTLTPRHSNLLIPTNCFLSNSWNRVYCQSHVLSSICGFTNVNWIVGTSIMCTHDLCILIYYFTFNLLMQPIAYIHNSSNRRIFWNSVGVLIFMSMSGQLWAVWVSCHVSSNLWVVWI